MMVRVSPLREFESNAVGDNGSSEPTGLDTVILVSPPSFESPDYPFGKEEAQSITTH